MRRLFTLSLVLCLTFATWAQKVGDTAPNFTLKTLDGSTVSLSDYSGKVVMVFFFGFNCGPCISAGPKVQATIVNNFKANPNFVALGIDVWNGNNTGVQNFRDASRLDIPLLMQGSGVRTAWNTERDRLIVVDSNGEFSFIGKNLASNDAESAKQNISTALENVSTELQEVTKGSGNLVQVYPNPIQENAQIMLNIDAPGHVNVSVYDLSGNLVRQLYGANATAGKLAINFSRDNLPKGVYFYRVTNENSVASGKLVLN